MSDEQTSGGIATPIVTIVIGLFFLGYSIALAIYFGRAKDFADQNPSINPPISANTAIFLMWVSIIMALVSVAIVVIFIIVLVRKSGSNKAKSKDIAANNAQSNDKSNTITDSQLILALQGSRCSTINDVGLRNICNDNRNHINVEEDCTVKLEYPSNISHQNAVKQCQLKFKAKDAHTSNNSVNPI